MSGSFEYYRKSGNREAVIHAQPGSITVGGQAVPFQADDWETLWQVLGELDVFQNWVVRDYAAADAMEEQVWRLKISLDGREASWQGAAGGPWGLAVIAGLINRLSGALWEDLQPLDALKARAARLALVREGSASPSELIEALLCDLHLVFPAEELPALEKHGYTLSWPHLAALLDRPEAQTPWQGNRAHTMLSYFVSRFAKEESYWLTVVEDRLALLERRIRENPNERQSLLLLLGGAAETVASARQRLEKLCSDPELRPLALRTLLRIKLPIPALGAFALASMGGSGWLELTELVARHTPSRLGEVREQALFHLSGRPAEALACLALCELDSERESVVPALLRLVEVQPAFQEEVLKVLALLGPPLGPAVPWLVSLVTGPSNYLRYRSLRLLVAGELDAEWALPLLRCILQDAEMASELQEDALQLVRRLSETEQIRTLCSQAMLGPGRALASKALALLGVTAPSALKEAATSARDMAERCAAAGALAALVPAELPWCLDFLTRMLEAPNSRLRDPALRALAELGVAAAQVGPALRQLQKVEPDSRWLDQALQAVGPAPGDAQPLCLDVLRYHSTSAYSTVQIEAGRSLVCLDIAKGPHRQSTASNMRADLETGAQDWETLWDVVEQIDPWTRWALPAEGKARPVGQWNISLRRDGRPGQWSGSWDFSDSSDAGLGLLRGCLNLLVGGRLGQAKTGAELRQEARLLFAEDREIERRKTRLLHLLATGQDERALQESAELVSISERYRMSHLRQHLGTLLQVAALFLERDWLQPASQLYERAAAEARAGRVRSPAEDTVHVVRQLGSALFGLGRASGSAAALEQGIALMRKYEAPELAQSLEHLEQQGVAGDVEAVSG